MADRLPGTKFILFALVCFVAAGYIAAVSGNFAPSNLQNLVPFLDDSRSFEAELTDGSGLAIGDDVRIAGVDVGRVNAIRLEQGVAVVSFTVEPEIEPTTTWQAGARWRNAIGQRFLYLYPQPGGTPLAQDGTIPVEQSVAVADLAAFVGQVTPLLEAIDPESQNKLTEALTEVLVGREDDIQNLVVNLSDLASTVSDEEPEIRAVIANANLLLSEFNAREQELTSFIDNLALVANTLANRNGELLDAAVDIADVQEQLRLLIEANDDGLVESLDNVERITQSIALQRDDFELSIASLRQGLATYMLTSRSGEWFNVRAVATQVQNQGQIINCTTETGTTCGFPNSSPDGQPSTTPTSAGARAAAPDTISMSPMRLNAVEIVTSVPLLTLEDAVASADSASDTAGGE